MATKLRALVKRAMAGQDAGSIRQEEIARLAYELFEQRGGVHGNDQENWFEAERILRGRRRSGNGR